jgi:hypothetical protein
LESQYGTDTAPGAAIGENLYLEIKCKIKKGRNPGLNKKPIVVKSIGIPLAGG